MALKGHPASWDTLSFRQGVCSRSKFPKLDRLKVDCIQEECMQLSRGMNISSTREDMQVLSTQVNKKKKKQKFKGKRKQPDYSKMQCFRCDKYGHPASKCPDR